MPCSSSYMKYLALWKDDRSIEALISAIAGGHCETGICPIESGIEQASGYYFVIILPWLKTWVWAIRRQKWEWLLHFCSLWSTSPIFAPRELFPKLYEFRGIRTQCINAFTRGHKNCSIELEAEAALGHYRYLMFLNKSAKRRVLMLAGVIFPSY